MKHVDENGVAHNIQNIAWSLDGFYYATSVHAQGLWQDPPPTTIFTEDIRTDDLDLEGGDLDAAQNKLDAAMGKIGEAMNSVHAWRRYRRWKAVVDSWNPQAEALRLKETGAILSDAEVIAFDAVIVLDPSLPGKTRIGQAPYVYENGVIRVKP